MDDGWCSASLWTKTVWVDHLAASFKIFVSLLGVKKVSGRL